MEYYVCGYTNAGNYRVNNEDAILADRKVSFDGCSECYASAPFICAVCDGVSGENSGDIASRLCLDELSKINYSSSVNLSKVLMQIHRKIKQEGISRENSANMQTTLCALAIDEFENAVCVNVGDSRMYRYANGEIRQLSTDQSYGQYLYQHGQIDSMDDLPEKYQSAIISSIGSTLNEPEIVQTPLVSRLGSTEDDTVLIMSDGISDYVSENELEVGMGMDLTLREKVMAIAELALMNGSADNISIIAVKPIVPPPEPKREEHKISETDSSLDGILDIDLNEILNRPKEKPKPKTSSLTSDDLLKMAQESLSKLSKL